MVAATWCKSIHLYFKMADYQPPSVCDCCASPCPVPYQQREVRTLGFFEGYSFLPGWSAQAQAAAQESLNLALAELRMIPWTAALGTAISYVKTTGGVIYMSESRARWVVPETHYGNTNIQNYSRYKIGEFYNGGSGTNYTIESSQVITWNGPGTQDIETRASAWVEYLVDDWAIVDPSGNLDHRGFVSRQRSTCYSSEIWA